MKKSDEPLVGPPVPVPLGYAEASVALQTVSAPLLAGASLTLLGVIVVDAGDFRWPGLTLLIVVSASMALIASMQIGADARQYLYNRDTINAWYTEDEQRRSAGLKQRRERDFHRWRRRNRRAAIAFNTGTLLLILAVSTALAPPGRDQAVWRWIAAGLALAGAFVEAWWVHRLFRRDGPPRKKTKSLDGGKS
ncbi:MULTISPECIES: hypothetical protein [unclassified Streptomyces]|jgi:hypothetical protein|uniref:hypothetical protein n=1 Tax=unclassified Streptomyces TaxID=2593676 RepID=UPI0011C07235|nr:hypothetical protein [Streptomyces sp. M7]